MRRSKSPEGNGYALSTWLAVVPRTTWGDRSASLWRLFCINPFPADVKCRLQVEISQLFCEKKFQNSFSCHIWIWYEKCMYTWVQTIILIGPAVLEIFPPSPPPRDFLKILSILKFCTKIVTSMWSISGHHRRQSEVIIGHLISRQNYGWLIVNSTVTLG